MKAHIRELLLIGYISQFYVTYTIAFGFPFSSMLLSPQLRSCACSNKLGVRYLRSWEKWL